MQWLLFPIIVGVVVYLFTVNWFEQPCLKLKQYFCVANYLVSGELYFCSYVNVINKGKQPIGLEKATLEVILNKKIQKRVDCIPVFLRYYISDEAKAPSIDNPFFYTATFYENTVKDKEGKTRSYNYHPKELIPREVVLKTGDYENGYLFFKLKDIPQNLREITHIIGKSLKDGAKKSLVNGFL